MRQLGPTVDDTHHRLLLKMYHFMEINEYFILDSALHSNCCSSERVIVSMSFAAAPPRVPATSLLFKCAFVNIFETLGWRGSTLWWGWRQCPALNAVKNQVSFCFFYLFLWKCCLISTAKAERFRAHIVWHKWDLKWYRLFIVKEGEIKEFSQKACVGPRAQRAYLWISGWIVFKANQGLRESVTVSSL